MADQNQDLALVVAEILIEIHGLGERLHRVDERLTSVEKAVNRMAEVMLLQQQETNRKLELILEGNKSNTEMLIAAFRGEATVTRSRLDDYENRIGTLENK